jgi:electron transport complex protein RnfA
MLSALFTDNFVLSKFWGICPFLGVSKKLQSSLGMGVAVTIVMVFAAVFTHLAYAYILTPLHITYIRTVVFILIIAIFVQATEMALKKWIPPLHKSLGVYLPLIATNCVVLGVTILNIDAEYTLPQATVNALFAGLGFALVLFIFAGVRRRLETSDIPEVLQGVPITLIAASIVAMSFMGFK